MSSNVSYPILESQVLVINTPLRVGKKQQRAVLDNQGREVVIFPKGKESLATLFCKMINNLDK